MPHLVSRRGALTAALAGVGTFLSACSPIRIVNALVPSETYQRTADIAFGAHPRLALDVYVPEPAPAAAPVVVFFYGGNWNSGQRRDYVFVGEALASRGIVAVIPDYRLYPEVRYPDFLGDCAQAVAWTTRNIGRFGGDSRRLFLMGHSAGAYNAAMLALQRDYLRRADVVGGSVQGLIGLAGPYDFLPLEGEITRRVFGYPDTPRTTQPIEHVSADDPRALLITGTPDETVNPGNTERLAEKLRARGVPVRVVVYPGVGHVRLAGALAAPFRGIAPVLDEVTTFVRGQEWPSTF